MNDFIFAIFQENTDVNILKKGNKTLDETFGNRNIAMYSIDYTQM
jgi:hypothetical protein